MPITDATGRVWYPHEDRSDPVAASFNGVSPKLGTGMCSIMQSELAAYTGISSDFEIGTQDFTVQAYMYWDTVVSGCNPEWFFMMPTTLEITFFGDPSFGIYTMKVFAIATMHEVYSNSFTFPQNTWVHFAVVRYSGVLTFYMDGLSIGSDSLTDYIACPTDSSICFPGWTPV